jgi:uncharacterized glyoxalase superfamily protein PhnB
VTPYLLYEDAGAAVDWLCKAFGFEEKVRMNDDAGKVNHAEVGVVDSVVMLGHPGPDYQSPATHGHPSQAVYIYVDGIDAHFERAKAAGATVLQEPADQFFGDRTYMVADPEGHQWNFAEHVRDVPPEEMHP